EEVGDFGGARTVTFSLEPAIAIAVDVTHSTAAPGGEPKIGGGPGLGSGPATSRGSTINPRVFDLLVEAAEAEGIPYTIEVSAGTTNTEMEARDRPGAGGAAG